MTWRFEAPMRGLLIAISMFMLASGSAHGQAAKPNIPVIWGDDIG